MQTERRTRRKAIKTCLECNRRKQKAREQNERLQTRETNFFFFFSYSAIVKSHAIIAQVEVWDTSVFIPTLSRIWPVAVATGLQGEDEVLFWTTAKTTLHPPMSPTRLNLHGSQMARYEDRRVLRSRRRDCQFPLCNVSIQPWAVTD